MPEQKIMTWSRQFANRVVGSVVNLHRFKDSVVFNWYVRLAYPGRVRHLVRSQEFLRQLLAGRSPSLVFDIGANCGHKTMLFAACAEKVVSVEPDPTAAKILKERFLHKPGITVLHEGVGASPGVAPFHIFGGADYYNTFSLKWADELTHPNSHSRPALKTVAVVDVPITTLDQLIGQHGVPAYVKIDVEGYELEVIKGLSRPVYLLSFECNLPEFAPETLECIARLAELSPAARFNYCTSDPPDQFCSEQWRTPAQMVEFIQTGGLHYLEIYCKTS